MKKYLLFFLTLFFVSNNLVSYVGLNEIDVGTFKITNADISGVISSLKDEMRGIFSDNDGKKDEVADIIDDSFSSSDSASMFKLKKLCKSELASKMWKEAGVQLRLKEFTTSGNGKYSLTFDYKITESQFLKWITLNPLYAVGSVVKSEVTKVTGVVKYFVVLYITAYYVYPYVSIFIFNFIKKHPWETLNGVRKVVVDFRSVTWLYFLSRLNKIYSVPLFLITPLMSKMFESSSNIGESFSNVFGWESSTASFTDGFAQPVCEDPSFFRSVFKYLNPFAG